MLACRVCLAEVSWSFSDFWNFCARLEILVTRSHVFRLAGWKVPGELFLSLVDFTVYLLPYLKGNFFLTLIYSILLGAL